MNSLKNSMRWAKILTFAFALSFLMFCFPNGAMADSCSNPGNPISQPSMPFDRMIPIKNGSFQVDTGIKCLGQPKVIRSAIVSVIPENAVGSIDSIIITGANGKREFGCNPSKVKQGTNLIRACGGPAVLESGDVRYEAKGSNFGSDPVRLGINFSSDFQP